MATLSCRKARLVAAAIHPKLPLAWRQLSTHSCHKRATAFGKPQNRTTPMITSSTSVPTMLIRSDVRHPTRLEKKNILPRKKPASHEARPALGKARPMILASIQPRSFTRGSYGCYIRFPVSVRVFVRR